MMNLHKLARRICNYLYNIKTENYVIFTDYLLWYIIWKLESWNERTLPNTNVVPSLLMSIVY